MAKENDAVEDIPYSHRFRRDPVRYWAYSVLFGFLHTFALCGIFVAVKGQVMWQTYFFALLLHMAGMVGTTAGVHRLWAHQCYKAKTPLKLMLLFMQTIAGEHSVWEWTRDHRLHHKYTDTDADPHNSKRGFFFSHIGWMMSPKHAQVLEKEKTIPMKDIECDRILMLQDRYFLQLSVLFGGVFPTITPWIVWKESLVVAFLTSSSLRYAVTLHSTFLVNSAAHMWGSRPYDKNINPAENKAVAFFTVGEGWHNYHHVFPWDYKAAELGNYTLNFTTSFIDFFAWIGWAHDLKSVPKDIVEKRIQKNAIGF